MFIHCLMGPYKSPHSVQNEFCGHCVFMCLFWRTSKTFQDSSSLMKVAIYLWPKVYKFSKYTLKHFNIRQKEIKCQKSCASIKCWNIKGACDIWNLWYTIIFTFWYVFSVETNCYALFAGTVWPVTTQNKIAVFSVIPTLAPCSTFSSQSVLSFTEYRYLASILTELRTGL